MNNKTSEPSDNGEMQPEYDFAGGTRGKHHKSYQRGYKITAHKADGSSEEGDFVLPDGAVTLDPDVRSYFPNAEAVNDALRSLIKLLPQ